jgi:hypothetical protein
MNMQYLYRVAGRQPCAADGIHGPFAQPAAIHAKGPLVPLRAALAVRRVIVSGRRRGSRYMQQYEGPLFHWLTLRAWLHARAGLVCLLSVCAFLAFDETDRTGQRFVLGLRVLSRLVRS